MSEPKIVRNERTIRVQKRDPLTDSTLDICYVKKSGRVVVHTYKPGQIPGVVAFDDIDDLHGLLDTLYQALPAAKVAEITSPED